MADTASRSSDNRKQIRFVVFNGIVAALYVVFTAPFANIAYGPIQVRIAVNGLIVGGYLPFLLVDSGSSVTLQAVLLSMLSVAGSEAVLLLVLGLPLMFVMEKTGLKKRLP